MLVETEEDITMENGSYLLKNLWNNVARLDIMLRIKNMLIDAPIVG